MDIEIFLNTTTYTTTMFYNSVGNRTYSGILKVSIFNDMVIEM